MIKPQFIEVYPLKFFNYQGKEDYIVVSPETRKKAKLDKIDLGILKILADDARTKLIDIATKLGISAELAHYRLKKLKAEKVILGNRIQFNMSALGYFITHILINFRTFSEKNKRKIREFAKKSMNINSLMINLHKPHCILNFFHKGEHEVREAIEEIRKLFENEAIEIDTLHIGQDIEEVRVLPFLE